MAQKDKEELECIKEVQKTVQNTESSLNSALKKNPPDSEEINRLQNQLISDRKYLQSHISEHKINGQDRNKYLTRLDKLKKYYIWSVTEERHPFQNGILKFKKKMMRLVTQSAVSSMDDSKNTEDLTKKCPKCGFKIYKQGGCIYVQCSNCHYEFCWVCEQAFVPPHGDHHVCPVYSLTAGDNGNHVIDGIDYDDERDKRFYPMPLDLQRLAEYVTFNDAFMQYNKSADSLEKLESLLDERGEVRRKLVKALMEENSEEGAEKFARQVANDVLFAPSVMVWGFPQLFFMQNNPGGHKFIEYSLIELEEKVRKIVDTLKTGAYSNSPTSGLKLELDIIGKNGEAILKAAEGY